MRTDQLISWRTADERGLKPVMVLEIKVQKHPRAEVYFVEQLVEYDNGERGWRRKIGHGPSGAPYTIKFASHEEAEAEVVRLRREAVVGQATRILTEKHHPQAHPLQAKTAALTWRGDLRALWDSELGRGQSPDGQELAVLHAEQLEFVDRAQEAIAHEDMPAAPSFDLKRAFIDGARTRQEAVAWWKDVLERRNAVREANQRADELKERKAEERSERRQREDEFLQAKAAEVASEMLSSGDAPSRGSLALVGRSAPGQTWEPEDPDAVLGLIEASIRSRPYLRHVFMAGFPFFRLYVSSDGKKWEEYSRYEKNNRKQQIAERALIADAFGLDPKGHWGKVRGELLRMLKPRELDLLHRRDVQEALEKARGTGKELVVIGNHAFLWDEEQQQWQPRRLAPRPGGNGSSGSALWLEGPIHSTNYGRVIVLPYIKEDGTQVPGHTRNAPHEGEALPRSKPRIISFLVYDELGRDEVWDHYGNRLIPDDQADGA